MVVFVNGNFKRRLFIRLLMCVVPVMVGGQLAHAETIYSALASAYTHNPTLNAQRAATRSVDENVPLAKSGWRPTIFGTADYGYSSTRTQGVHTELNPGGFGITISQTLFDGLKTLNSVHAAQAAVAASQATLRNTEQNVLFDGATAYMDVLQNQAIVAFRTKNLEFLREEVRAANARFSVGEATRTDVAQAKARSAAAVTQLAVARANLKTSKGVYFQVIGKKPRHLKPAKSLSKYFPKSVHKGMKIALRDHPAVIATKHLVDQAAYNVKTAESSLLPTITLDGSASRRFNSTTQGQVIDSAQITANLRVPIYQGGSVSSTVRQNKEILSQRRIEVDQSVDNVRAAVVSAYSQYESAQANILSSQAQLSAANLALKGVIEERNVGQRTTLDVLTTQQEVINAQIALVQSRRNLVVASYAILSAIGRLNAKRLGLGVKMYHPEDHYVAVRDKWYGLRTPDKR